MTQIVSKLFSGQIDKPKKGSRYIERYKYFSEETKKLIRLVHPIELVVKLVKFYRERIIQYIKDKDCELDLEDKLVNLIIDRVVYAIVTNPELISEYAVKKVAEDILKWSRY